MASRLFLRTTKKPSTIPLHLLLKSTKPTLNPTPPLQKLLINQSPKDPIFIDGFNNPFGGLSSQAVPDMADWKLGCRAGTDMDDEFDDDGRFDNDDFDDDDDDDDDEYDDDECDDFEDVDGGDDDDDEEFDVKRKK